MDSESKELLREWLVRSLEPVCDADPEVLSKYVLALIQNDPKKDGLKETCIAKLEEFLGDETGPFVSRLFTALETESYRREEHDSHESDNRRDEPRSSGRDHHRDHHRSDSHYRDEGSSRRRGRGASDEEDDGHDRHAKRRRDDEYSRDDRRNSPRRGGSDSRREPRDGGRGGRAAGGRGGDWDRRRNFPPEWGMPPPGMWPPHYAPPRGGYPPHPMGDFDPNVYNPENPGMMPPPHMMMGGRHMGGPYYAYPGRGRGRGGYGGRSAGGPTKNGEDGAAPGEAFTGGAKTTLRVSNVDPKYVNMTKLSLHFSKFGNVVNVQMRPNHRCAYVQYATEEEAKKAFHSPIPVCNNRFIEVKWAKYDAKDPHGAPSEEAEEGKNVTDADGGDQAGKSDGDASVSPTAGEMTTEMPEKEMTPEELRAAALEKGRKVLEEKRELLEKQKQLMKQKEELLKRQLAQQKELLERMSQNPASVSAADKRELLNKITTLSEELKALQPRRDSGDQSKLSGLKAELSALEAAASGSYAGRGGRGGRWAGSPAASGRGFYRGGRGGRGRGSYGQFSNTLDNRTTIVKVENLPEEARDPSVLEQHFSNFGGVERVVVDENAPDRGFIKFQDRYAGQAALARGGVFGDARLSLSWVEASDAPSSLAPPTPSGSNAGGGAEMANESSEVSASA